MTQRINPNWGEEYKNYSRSEWQDVVNTAFAVLQLGHKDEGGYAAWALATGAAMGILPEEDALQQFVETFNSLVDEGVVKAPKFQAPKSAEGE